MSRAPATPAIAILTRRVAWGLVEVLVVVMLVLVLMVLMVLMVCPRRASSWPLKWSRWMDVVAKTEK